METTTTAARTPCQLPVGACSARTWVPLALPCWNPCEPRMLRGITFWAKTPAAGDPTWPSGPHFCTKICIRASTPGFGTPPETWQWTTGLPRVWIPASFVGIIREPAGLSWTPTEMPGLRPLRASCGKPHPGPTSKRPTESEKYAFVSASRKPNPVRPCRLIWASTTKKCPWWWTPSWYLPRSAAQLPTIGDLPLPTTIKATCTAEVLCSTQATPPPQGSLIQLLPREATTASTPASPSSTQTARNAFIPPTSAAEVRTSPIP